ncbi:MAG: group II intron reverse transcriptase/maturase [Proteobacteria bacterium]|nr:group II intron reverse transcriptase/maturase [Pseudomonadota bacterium]
MTTKPISIAKRDVWQAYKRVKANRGSAGIDRQSIEDFEQDLKGNLYKIWNRLSSGSYFPPAVKQVGIEKKSGGIRYLGVPTVSDRIAQMVVKLQVEPLWDSHFHPDSYGYRPGKSAKDAVAVTRQRCWRYDWVVEFDIKGAFDHIDHELLLKAVRKHTPEKWMVMYIERWLTAPFITPQGETVQRTQGTPQGGVVSPLLMNLFMHYAFDLWMGREYPRNPFARYADDAVVHCMTLQDAEQQLAAIAERLSACGLTVHPKKSKIVYCKDDRRRGHYENVQFTFLGFTFGPRCAQRKDGSLFTGYLPAVSDEAVKAMRSQIRSWRLHRLTYLSLGELAGRYNRVLQGWWNYYSSFYRSALQRVFAYFNRKLMHWVRRKYRRFKGRTIASQQWLQKVCLAVPNLFVGWQVFGIPLAR